MTSYTTLTRIQLIQIWLLTGFLMLQSVSALAHHCKGDHASDPGCDGGGSGGGGEPESANCSDIYFGGTPGLCTAAGTQDECILSRFFDNTPGWRATQDCDLRATLVTPASDPIFNGEGHTFNLVADWSGEYAGFSNGSGNVRIVNLTINVASTAVANGCTGLDTARTAIWIDQDAPDSGVPRPTASDVTITASNDARFCNAIEYRGSDPQIRTPQFGGGVTGSIISGESYERAAIWVSDLNLTDNVKGQPKTWDFAAANDNQIEGSCNPGSVGIYFGPNVERGRVQSNFIFPNGSGCGNAIGVLVTDSGRAKTSGNEYDFLAPDPIIVEQNEITTDTSGGSIAIIFDADSEATTDSNVLTAGDSGDTGFCIETGAGVELGQGKKADSFDSFGTNIDTQTDC